MKLIDKDKVVAEIVKRWKEWLRGSSTEAKYKKEECDDILYLLYNIKEIDGITIEREVKVDAGGYPYIPQIELYDYEKDIPLAKAGDKVKLIIMKGG